MRERLESFKALCEAYDLESRRAGYAEFTDRQQAITDEMSSQMPTVREILKRLDPALAKNVELPTYMGGASSSLRAVQQGLGILRDQDEWAANLAPDAPSLIADQFHPHVWAAASALWDTGQYRVAVGQAAVSLSAHIAKKAASLLSDRDLVNRVLAPGEPGPGQVRLHFAGDKLSRTWRSRQEGLHLLAQGAFAGIRNVATHTGDEWPEHVALQHLAVLSVVARWADETEVITGSEAPRQPGD
ncbi:MAG: TIGR02391 family protein [Streptosporangiaceae bacterium]